MNEQQFLNWERASRDTIDFKKTYVDIAGDLNAGLMLSEIVYWHLPNKEGEAKLRVKHDDYLWIACRRYEWWDRTRLSPKQADRALSILADRGLIDKAIYKFDGDPTIHVRLQWDRFLPAWDHVVADPPENPYSPKVNNDIDETETTESTKRESPVTEGITEGTAEHSKDFRSGATRRPDNFASRPAQPKTGDTKTVDENAPRDKEYTPLARTIMALLKRNRLTAAQQRKLTEKVLNYNDPNSPIMLSPNDLFDADENFREYVKWKINSILSASNGAAARSPGKFVNVISNYSHPAGWLAYQKKRGIMPEEIDHGFDDDYDDNEADEEPIKGYGGRKTRPE